MNPRRRVILMCLLLFGWAASLGVHAYYHVTLTNRAIDQFEAAEDRRVSECAAKRPDKSVIACIRYTDPIPRHTYSGYVLWGLLIPLALSGGVMLASRKKLSLRRASAIIGATAGTVGIYSGASSVLWIAFQESPQSEFVRDATGAVQWLRVLELVAIAAAFGAIMTLLIELMVWGALAIARRLLGRSRATT